MECLFKTTTTYTLNEYKEFTKTILFRQSAVVMIIFELFFVAMAFLLHDIFSLVFAVLFLLFFYVLALRSASKTYKSHKIAQNRTVEFEFYGEHFIENTEISTEKIEYKMLHKIIETKTNFYLMIAKNQGYILIKENFPEGLADFLRNKRDELNLK